MTTDIKRAARVIREEIVRQYRDDDRGKCPTGAAFYEENIAPRLIANAALSAVFLDPSDEVVRAAHDAHCFAGKFGCTDARCKEASTCTMYDPAVDGANMRAALRAAAMKVLGQ